MEKQLWEILVPTMRNNGKPYSTRYHRVWDSRVRKISGGLTICPPSKGQWVSPSGLLFRERMIPVRILATRDQIEEIVKMSLVYYDQEAVFAYQVSTNIMLHYRNTNDKTSTPKKHRVSWTIDGLDPQKNR
jgi:hypothetical protein